MLILENLKVMSIYSYFKPVNNLSLQLPAPQGPLSMKVPSSSIEAANKKVLEQSSTSHENKKRGSYNKYSPQEKAKISNFAVQHGTSAALRHFKEDFPGLKWTTVNDWKEAMIKQMKKNHSSEPILKLQEKRRGRPCILTEQLTEDLKSYLYAVREAGGVVNTAIVIAAGTGMLLHRDPGSLECNGGHIVLKKGWAKYFLGKMNFVKRKATTKSKVTVDHFKEVKEQFLFDIKAVVEMEEIPDSLIINWDQTGINYVPVSQWTMAKEGSKRVEVVGINDKRQITAVFAGNMAGDFLPVQLVYQGKTQKCLPNVDFPETWHITCTPNHWCNEDTVVQYIEKILIPYVTDKKKELGLPTTYPALTIFDEFKGQTTDRVLSILENNNIFCLLTAPTGCNH